MGLHVSVECKMLLVLETPMPISNQHDFCKWWQLLKLDDRAIAEMVFFPVINEACRVLGEGIAIKASDLDIASIFGMGFPPYRYLDD